MIIDVHTHIFPPEMRDRREDYLRRDATFAEMYSSPKAKIATAEELLESMERSGVDVSVALGFAWSEHELIVRHNDYLLEAAAASNGRIIPFCTINPALPDAEEEAVRCAEAGARGFGELRFGSQNWNPAGPEGDWLASFAVDYGLFLLFHVSEPVGRDYAGKPGGDLRAFYDFALRQREVGIIGAHLAGGLPLYMPLRPVPDVFINLWVDTAAQTLLYDGSVYHHLGQVIQQKQLLFGSDYPLVEQSRQIAEIRAGIRSDEREAQVLGGTAAWLLGIQERAR